MMNAKKEKLELEFIRRTYENLKGYQGEYEITALVNSLLGLMIIPQQWLLDELKTVSIQSETLEALKNAITRNSYSQNVDILFFVHRIRNAAAHFRISFEGEENVHIGKSPQIEKVVFEDQDDKNKSQFSMTLSVSLLSDFLEEVTSGLLQRK